VGSSDPEKTGIEFTKAEYASRDATITVDPIAALAIQLPKCNFIISLSVERLQSECVVQFVCGAFSTYRIASGS